MIINASVKEVGARLEKLDSRDKDLREAGYIPVNIESTRLQAYTNPFNGESLAVDESGTAEPCRLQALRKGDRVYTREQLGGYSLKLGWDRQRLAQKGAGQKREKFCFLSRREEFKEPPKTISRLIYLVSFAGFNDNKLRYANGKPIKQKDLSPIMRLSKCTVIRFWREVNPKYLEAQKDGAIIANTKIFRHSNSGETSFRLYSQYIQKLYMSLDNSKHKYLGLIFTMLPFINVRYNVLCHEPLLENANEIVPMTFGEFADRIEYSTDNLNKLYDIYRSLRFDVGDGKKGFAILQTEKRPL